jgi:hypothetical protein
MMRITDQYKNIEVLGDNTRSIPAQVWIGIFIKSLGAIVVVIV